MDSEAPPGSALLKALRECQGATAYVVDMVDDRGLPLGNNGDRLMHDVMERLLEAHAIRRATHPSSAEIVLVPPNGALLETYSFPRLLTSRLRPYVDKPLIVFPSSANFPTVDPTQIFAGRRARTLWLVRERNTLRQLTSLWGRELANSGVELDLDHDVVVTGQDHLPSIFRTGGSRPGISLVAARVDREAGGMRTSASDPDGRRLQWAKAQVQQLPAIGPWATRVTLARRSALRGRNLVASLPDAARSALERNRTVSKDISDPTLASYDEYRDLISRASVVVTDRLHVALPSALLGKDVFLGRAGYHKLAGVFEMSLATLANVRLLEQM